MSYTPLNQDITFRKDIGIVCSQGLSRGVGRRSFQSTSESDHVVVAAAQLRPRTISESLSSIVGFIQEAAGRGVQLLVFPETALTSYDEQAILQATREQLASAEIEIQKTCAANTITAIVGTAHYDSNGVCYNSATVIGPDGVIIGRQHKLQLVPPDRTWSKPGEVINVFDIGGIRTAIIICHDKRYPELVRLPVLAGARLIFYMACEAWHDDLPLPYPRDPPWSQDRLNSEMNVYQAQIQARAVENRVWIVKSNFAGCLDDPQHGSHGKSCIIDPTGIVRVEADIYSEELIMLKIDAQEANALYAEKSVSNGYLLADFWKAGLKHVCVH